MELSPSGDPYQSSQIATYFETFLEKPLDCNSGVSRTEVEIKQHERQALADAAKAEIDAQKALEEAEKSNNLDTLKRVREGDGYFDRACR